MQHNNIAEAPISEKNFKDYFILYGDVDTLEHAKLGEVLKILDVRVHLLCFESANVFCTTL